MAHVDRASTGPRHHCRGSPPLAKVVGFWCFASTGPRHHCRGSIRARNRGARHEAVYCFNGAPTSLPGIGGCRGAEWETVALASTGPRHHCRGSLGVGPWPTRSDRASTGPRHHCRGSSTTGRRASRSPLASTGPRHHCRGSAATRRPRIASPLTGFNGAPTSLPGIALARRCLSTGFDINAGDR